MYTLITSSADRFSVFATTTIIPAAPQVISDLHVTHVVYRTLLVSIWELGEGIGPFLYAPLSEKFGRLPVYHIGNVLGLGCSIAGALSVNISMLVAFRFLNGSVLTALTLSPTITSDLFPVETRGLALAIEGGLQFTGAVIAPLCGAFLAQAYGWRWTIWINGIAIGAIGLLSLFVIRETYDVKILERKAARLKRETGNAFLYTQHHTDISPVAVLTSFTRPMQKLFTSPTVFLTTIYNSVMYAFVYTILTTITVAMEDIYRFNQGTVGLAFLPGAIGALMGMVFYGLTSDRFIAYMKTKDNGVLIPERRFAFLLLSAVIMPGGLFMYGWTVAARVQYMAPLMATAVTGFASMLSNLAITNYMADAFGKYSASAIAAGIIPRALCGTGLPLVGPVLYQRLGYGWGNSLLAFISIGFIPPLWFLVYYKMKDTEINAPSEEVEDTEHEQWPLESSYIWCNHCLCS